MKIEQKHIDVIRADFEKLRSKADFIDLLNYAKPFIYGSKFVPFNIRQLNWYADPKLCKKPYREFKIKKKSGAERSIHAPVRGLKALQMTTGFILQCVFEPHYSAMGFVRNKSILDNAKIHVGKKYVYNIDLKDFFSSIDQARVWKCLQLNPFNLRKSTSDYELNKSEILYQDPLTNKCSRLKIANAIASICCTEMIVERINDNGELIFINRRVLPQGAPTSPVITNIVCQRLDYVLSAVANRFGLSYSRYADDITFSSEHNVFQNDSPFLKEIQRVISEQGFRINEKKTRLQKDGYRKEVTGLLVNNKVNVQKRYLKQIRLWLYYWERYGYDRAYGFFIQQYKADKKNIISERPDMASVIGGKLDFLKMVKGSTNLSYLGLKKRFDRLINKTDLLEHILDIWEKEGIIKASAVFYKKRN